MCGQADPAATRWVFAHVDENRSREARCVGRRGLEPARQCGSARAKCDRPAGDPQPRWRCISAGSTPVRTPPPVRDSEAELPSAGASGWSGSPGQSVGVDERLVAVCVREQELGEQSCWAVKVLAGGDEQHELTLEFQALNGNDL